MTSRARVAGGILVVLLVTGGGVLVLLGSQGGVGQPAYVPDSNVVALEGIDPATVRIERELEAPVGVAKWSVVSYRSQSGPCLHASGQLLSGGDSGELGGCGEPDGPFLWFLGGVELGGNWYNVAFGRDPGGAVAAMKVVLEGGGSLRANLVDGIWIVVVPGPQELFEVARIEALDSAGSVVSGVTPPSLREARQREREALGHSG